MLCTNADEETALLSNKTGTANGRDESSSSWLSRMCSNPVMTGLVGVLIGYLLTGHPSKQTNHTTVVVAPAPPPPVRPIPTTASTNSKYTKFQALTFQLYTGGAPVYLDAHNTTNPECHDLTIQGMVDGVQQCYMGHSNETQDVMDRMEILKAAVEKAYKVSSRSSETLKVFVVPEFFFRGRNGAYVLTKRNSTALFNDVNGICTGPVCRVLKGLENLVADARFQDWIFLFGTAIVSEELPKEDTYDFLFYNFGMLYKGYDPEKESRHGKRFIVPKRYVSTSDFLTPHRNKGRNETSEILQTALPQKTDMVLNPSLNLKRNKYDSRIWHVYKDELVNLGYHMIEYGWLIMDGLTLSIEICLDHDLQSALISYMADASMVQSTLIPSTNSSDGRVTYVPIPRHQAQLSIVSSAGMSVNENSMVLANEGSIILQDGLSGADSNKSWVFECFKHEWQFEGGSEVVQRKTTMTPTEVVFHFHVHQSYVKHSVFSSSKNKDEYWKGRLRGVFSNALYEPMITTYEPAPVAQVTAA